MTFTLNHPSKAVYCDKIMFSVKSRSMNAGSTVLSR